MSTLNEEDESETESNWQRTVRPVPSHEPPSARRPAHSRDSSAEKNAQQIAAGLASPRIPASHSRGVADRVVDPKSAIYGHHRQTSIVHGIQHSRNGSVASTTSSPLSPQLIAAAGAGFDRPDMHSVAARLENDAGLLARPSLSHEGPNGFPLDRAASTGDLALHGATQRRPERRQSKPRREHSQRPSHSAKANRDEQKTVGEYALHVLFTSVGTKKTNVQFTSH